MLVHVAISDKTERMKISARAGSDMWRASTATWHGPGWEKEIYDGKSATCGLVTPPDPRLVRQDEDINECGHYHL